MRASEMRGGWIGVLLGFVLVIWGAVTWTRAAHASQWPITPGQLTSAELTTHQQTDYDDKGRRTDTETYLAEVRYTYSVAGRRYSGTRYHLVDWSTSFYGRESWKVNRVRQQQAERGSIDVRYDPRRPQNSALNVRVGPEGLLGLNVGLALFFVGLGVVAGGPAATKLHTLAGGALVAVVAIGAPCFFLDWGVNGLLVVAWVLCLVLPLVWRPKPFRVGRRLR